MPTFRNNATDAELCGVKEIQALQKKFGEDIHILIKVHPHLAKKYHINNCSIPSENLYPIVDLLITDFSSALFDYSLFKKPFLIFAPDYKKFITTRGCYIDMEKELPCRIAKNQNELERFTLDALENDMVIGDSFFEKHLNKCDGNAIKRIIEYLGC